MTTRYMLDTVANPANGDVPNLPSSVKLPDHSVVPVSLQAGYVNGSFAWKSRHPDVWIDVNGSDPKAHVLDCETGDATPDKTPGWAKAHNGENPAFPAVIYCNRSNVTPVFNAMNAAGLRIARDFFIWLATLDGTRTVPDMTGVVAVQVYGASALGFNADLSFVYDDAFPHGGNPTTGPHRQVVPAGNTASLDRIVADRHGDLRTIIGLSRANLNPTNLAVFDAYLAYDAALWTAAGVHATIAAGTVYYTVN